MTIDDLLEHARLLVLPGFTPYDQVVDVLTELAADEDDDAGPVTDEAIAGPVRQVWDARTAEQRGWPPVTDADRLGRAFAALEADGIGAFGATDRTAFETGSLEVGHRVVTAIRAAGLTPDWDGTLDRRIAVTGLTWRRRLPS